MLGNYLKIAVRNLLKHKGYSAINVFGLAIGIACFVLIGLYVQDELSYDKYHSKSDRIYRVVELIEGAEESASLPFPVSGHLLNTYADYVESSTRFFNMQAPTVSISYQPDGGDIVRFSEDHFFYTDSTVFEVFDFEVVRGHPEKGLHVPNVIMVTESTAQRYFGDDDPIGKTLNIEGQFPISLEVVGILADTPENSHFKFDFLASLATLNQFSQNGDFQSNNWFWNPAWTYVLLAPNVAPGQLEAQFPKVVEENFPDQIKAFTSMWLQPLTDIHLTSKLDFEIRPNSDIAYVYIFSIIAVFVLLIACINFMNLSTARSAQRAKEVGVRKSVGAGRQQLVRQFLGESMISAFVAAAVSIPLVLAALPALNAVSGKNLWLDVANPMLWGALVLVPIVVGVFSGVYPAFFLSQFDPAEVLKGTFSSTKANAAVWLRRGLVATQFVISIVLIAGTIVAYQQLDYMRNKNLGFNTEEVVLVPILLTGFGQRFEAFRDEAERYPNIKFVTMLEDVPGSKYQTNSYQPEGMNEQVQFPRLTVHDDFVETFGMTLAAGRGYSREFPADSLSSIMVNQAFLDQLGWGTPEEAIGRQITFFGGGPGGPVARSIIGVFNDFHYASLHSDVGAFVVERYNSRQATNFFGRYLAIRITPDDVEGTLAFLENQWERYETSRAFEYFFLDEELDALYKSEATLGKVATTFSILAIFVACLGLFGMASFSAERRTKEIGVRKVMGASVPAIVMLLSRESIQLVAIAFLVAAPVAWFSLNSWLQGFSYHIEPTVFPLIVAGVTVLLISWITVSVQSMKAASAEPTKSLKYE